MPVLVIRNVVEGSVYHVTRLALWEGWTGM